MGPHVRFRRVRIVGRAVRWSSGAILLTAARFCSTVTPASASAACQAGIPSTISKPAVVLLATQHYADRTLELLLEHWCAVEALAEALVEHGRIEGDQVEQIIEHSMIWCAS